MKKIAIIGGGNLGSSIALGLLESGFVEPGNLTITRRNTKALDSFSDTGVQITSDNKATIIQSDIIIICLKPFQVGAFLAEFKNHFKEGQIIISTATGISIKEIQDSLSVPAIVFRAMPNTAIAIKESMTCIASADASPKHVEMVSDLFSTLGKVIFIEEKLMNAATVLGACGTAFAMRYIRANIQGGIQIGFDAGVAALIATQTIKGAAQLLLERNNHPEQEIDKVTTPKGCTIAGLNEMEHRGFSSALIKGLITSFDQIK